MNLSLKLRKRLKEGKILVAPGVFDPLSALLVKLFGFSAAYVGGASTSYSFLGMPDLGFVGAETMSSQISRIRNVIDLPLICDADTGYGNEVNVTYSVKLFEKMGANAIQIEDQLYPKRCGHLRGKEVISPEDMEVKVRAAIRARKDAIIVARTDALSVNGLEDAVERANRYVDAGADIAFVESPETIQHLEYIGKNVRGLKMANMVEGGKTPLINSSTLEEMGFNLVIYPGGAIRSSAKAISSMLSVLKREGTTKSFLDSMVSFTELQKILGTDEILKLK